MPGFETSAICRAPAEELWALLYDPTRFAEWWVGTTRIESTPAGMSRVSQTFPDRPVPLGVCASADRSQVTISCLAFDVDWEWTLEAVDAGCRVTLRVRIPEEQSQLVECQQSDMRASLERLVVLAEASADVRVP
jgi:uncharacterized protein YndB with AHSA1/START domain